MKAYCQETLGWIHFGRSEALNSISLGTGKNLLAINFLKQESWKQRVQTGEKELCLWNTNGMLASSLVYACKYWETNPNKYQ